ncbi:hypothetical protein AB1I58_08220 [Enterococcus hirae]|uniref:hypothetical protein n=1 Tax=Enterococcus hirae TaxID=1354 RepID=UPI003458B181
MSSTLGKIIQLEENGVPKFLRTHVNAIEGNETLVQTSGNQSVDGFKNFLQTPTVNGNPVLTVSDLKKKIYTLSMTDVPDGSITELKGELVREADHVTLQCRVNCSAGTKVVFRIKEGYRNSTDDIWEIPLRAISQSDQKNQVAYYQTTNNYEIKLITTVAGNHFISGTWTTTNPWPE